MHTAVGTKAYMVVYGGIPNDEWKWRGAGVSPMSIFVYSCGLWVNSTFKAFKIVIKVVEYVRIWLNGRHFYFLYIISKFPAIIFDLSLAETRPG